MHISIAAIIAVIVGLVMWWVESMFNAPLEDVAVQSANSATAYGLGWLGPALAIIFFLGGVFSLLVIFKK
jgi:hypothetical protein